MNKIKPKGMAGDIPVYCGHDEIVQVEKLIPNPMNPNHHPEKQLEALAKIISAQGWRAPITVSTRSGYIVRGHGRLQAALMIGSGFAPVDYQDYASEAEEHADLVADNRIAELAEINDKELADILETINTGEIDLELSGYSEEDLQDLIEELTKEYEEEPPAKEPPRVPMSRPGDIWKLGAHELTVGRTSGDDLIMADVMVGAYVEHTGNIAAPCVRDGEEIPYIDMAMAWARENDCDDMLVGKKVPIIKWK